MTPERQQILELVERWLSPEIQDMVKRGMKDGEIEVVNKIVRSIAISIRSLPE